VKNTRRSEAAERLQLTLELFQAGLDMKRQNLRREFPGATEQELEERLRVWLQQPPGAEHGDCSGRPRNWPAKSS